MKTLTLAAAAAALLVGTSFASAAPMADPTLGMQAGSDAGITTVAHKRKHTSKKKTQQNMGTDQGGAMGGQSGGAMGGQSGAGSMGGQSGGAMGGGAATTPR